MVTRSERRSDDVPPALALALLLVVLVLLAFGVKLPALEAEMAALGGVLEDNVMLFGLALASASFAAAWVSGQYRRIVGLTKQGSKLQAILGSSTAKSLDLPKKILLGLFLSLLTTAVANWALDTSRLPEFLSGSQTLVWQVTVGVTLVFVASGAFALAFAVYGPIHIMLGRERTTQKVLPAFPCVLNAVTLGSTGDEGGTDPAWVTVGRASLNGNILVTGSIGAGKTQGTILTYFDQIMGNFDPKPSVLAIDPKRTFVREALKILEKRGDLGRCLHMTLGGSVKFNPVYVEDALKGARFVDVAYMIQAAGTNFLGSSQDSKFWELNAFNLIRHSLVYCAASLDYYTLRDLYDAILASTDNALPEKIQELRDTKSLDEEAQFNLMRAYDYFALEFCKLDDKIRTSILTTATAFLNQFQEYQASQIFCPTRDEPRINSLDEIVDGGKVLLFDVSSPSLSKSMGTVMKLLYQKSLLDRLAEPKRGKEIPGLLLIDEYQDVVTTSHGASVGDDRFFAKGREANSISIVATQSLTSLLDAVGKESSAKSLFQCFRTRIAAHSSDLATIQSYQELVGQEERERVSRSVSELSQDAKKNHVLGGFESTNANISESVSRSIHKESTLTGKEFTALTSFETFALVYDGVRSTFYRLFLKPYFLENKAILHSDLIAKMTAATLSLSGFLSNVDTGFAAAAFPNICSVVNTPDFSSCMAFKVSACVCGTPPRPCAQFNYYVPTTYVETHPNPGETFFAALPAARSQLSSLPQNRTPFGAEGDSDTQSFHAHSLSVPLALTVLSQLPCSSPFRDTTCFEAMSEHLGANWTTGAGDRAQPNFLAWLASPKACLVAGAVHTGGGSVGGGSSTCSTQVALPTYPPSSHFACNGWGVFYPRVGVYNGVSQTAGALMVAARLKSLASEVFQSTPSVPLEKWQMILPQPSSCFIEGENLLPLETIKRATEGGRLLRPIPKGHLFTVWQPVSCCKDLNEVPTSQAFLAAVKAACVGGGGE